MKCSKIIIANMVIIFAIITGTIMSMIKVKRVRRKKAFRYVDC